VVHVAFLTKYRLQLIGVTLTVLLAIVIAFLTLAPISSKGVPGSDKLHHALAFAALAFPLPFARPGLVWPVILGVSAYGGLIEVIQPFFGREASWGDFLADVIGAVLGGVLGAQSGKWLRKLWRTS
jgi:VanZ family protein